MTVGPARGPEAAYPEPADTLACTSRTTASFVHKSLDAIKDQIVPANSADASAGTLATVSYTHLTLPTIHPVSLSVVAVSLTKTHHDT